MGSFSAGEFLNILCWGLIVVGVSWVLIIGLEKIKQSKIPDALKAAILIPVALSIAFSCAANFPIPI